MYNIHCNLYMFHVLLWLQNISLCLTMIITFALKILACKKNYINVTDGNAINLYFTNQNTPSKSRDVLTTNTYVNLIWTLHFNMYPEIVNKILHVNKEYCMKLVMWSKITWHKNHVTRYSSLIGLSKWLYNNR